MFKVSRLFPAAFAMTLPVLLAGCPGEYGGGYDKIPYRERTPVAMAAAPNPPPFVAGVGSGGGSDAPVLAAEITPPGVTQAMVEEGQRLYGTVCSACHGPAGAGTPAGPELRDQNWLHISGAYEEIVSIIQSGVPVPAQFPAPMPPLGGGNFSEDEVRAIGAYIFALSHQSGA